VVNQYKKEVTNPYHGLMHFGSQCLSGVFIRVRKINECNIDMNIPFRKMFPS
jgi:hypothetical protein